MKATLAGATARAEDRALKVHLHTIVSGVDVPSGGRELVGCSVDVAAPLQHLGTNRGGMAINLAAEAIRVPKAAELVALTLRRQIVTGELKEGDSLPSEALLMQKFHVSRPTLREAFRILESESLIRVRRGARGGAWVHVPDGDVAARYAGYVLEYRGTAMADVYKARVELEAPLARLMVADIKPPEISRMRALLSEAEEHLDDPESYAEYDVAFHLLVAELAGNQTLEVLVQMLYHIVGTARRRYTATIDRGSHVIEYRQVHKTHAKLVELAAAHEPEAAEDFWRGHLVEVSKHYLSRPIAKTVVEMMQ